MVATSFRTLGRTGVVVEKFYLRAVRRTLRGRLNFHLIRVLRYLSTGFCLGVLDTRGAAFAFAFPFLVSGSFLSSLPRDWLLRCIGGTSHLVHSRLYRCLVLRGHRRVLRILLFSTTHLSAVPLCIAGSISSSSRLLL